ncbi:PDZ domain-containing protein [Rothia sp. P7208]|uniref:YlbL family protein n=1 Tax=Rothia sp. P7208 TaxID=3402660 RepID=UPI003ABFB3DC
MQFREKMFSFASFSSHKRSRRDSVQNLCAFSTIGLAFLGLWVPVNFVTEEPGPTFNTIGSYKDQQLIGIEGEKTYPVTGALDMTTVSVAGGPNTDISAVHVLSTWLMPDTLVLPSDLVYPHTLTREEVTEQNTVDMANSQEVAQAAALKYLGKPFKEKMTVARLTKDNPNSDLIKPGDVLISLNGQKIEHYEQIAEILSRTGDKTLDAVIEREGKEEHLSLKPSYDEKNQKYILGLFLGATYEFPFKVNYGLEEVGGPSAGMMFALGIIDELTEKNLTGGKHFAGTGTIDAQGHVGEIGGIAQKMVGARQSGATTFIAPEKNCGEVIGHIPDGLSVVAVSTLDEAVHAVEGIAAGKPADSFRQCTDS